MAVWIGSWYQNFNPNDMYFFSVVGLDFNADTLTYALFLQSEREPAYAASNQGCQLLYTHENV